MNDKFLKPYNPSLTEGEIYSKWEESSLFNPDSSIKLGLTSKEAESFTIIMPPLNANGHIHAGHALTMTLQDILIRYKRMRGYKTLWVPGADHAGFETQIVYERKLEKEGRSRFKMDPQELFKEIMSFTLENKHHIQTEVKRLGASTDWSREKFTLDGDVVKEVHQTFKKMFDDGLVYRGKRIVNWCTKHQTSLSDVETDAKEMVDKLYYLQYGPITVATVRPETVFGDVAIAVHPEDGRYQKYIGTDIKVNLPTGEITLKVVGDESVDKEFGTGALKITPAHDKNDFELAARHNLNSIEVIDKFGKLNDKTGKYAGLKIKEARAAVVADMKESGLIIKEEEYTHAVPVCYKCETTIEPRILPQWFVKMEPLAKLALQAVNNKEIEFIPDHFEKIFTYWMEHPMDWNISRQIVWGIPIPAKLCTNCDYGVVDLDDSLHICPECQGNLIKDTDTFDTWFSSGQWPLLALGYPESEDFQTYYPTSMMETGSDLIFKWIPRMVIFGLYLTKKVPFKYVYLHGMVNDAKGKKMSKSKGNVINPLDLIEKFGTDALRMGLIIGNTPGNDISLQEDKIKGYKNFSNKLWNIARFVLSSTEGFSYDHDFTPTNNKDKKEIEEMIVEIEETTRELESFRMYQAAEKMYHYIWHNFADKIIEESKVILFDQSESEERKNEIKWKLYFILENSLKALHPFMPFVTEEIWQNMPHNKIRPFLMVEKWPEFKNPNK